jgi:hypothetical protein
VALFRDRFGFIVRVSAERLEHVLRHPEMVGLEDLIGVALAEPARVVQSRSDPAVWLYYRGVEETLVGPKLLCVVVKHQARVSYLLTAYLTDRAKRGQRIWPSDA